MTSASTRAVLATGATAVLAATAALCSAPAAADPMRPLLLASINATTSAGAASAPQATGSDKPLPKPAAPAPDPTRPDDRLVAIRHDGDRGWQALVGERWVAVGDRLGGQTVRAIGDNSLQLADARGQRSLHRLLPALQETPR